MSGQSLPSWFGSGQRSPKARVTLFCLPFSGGGASAYYRWRKLVPPEIEISPVHLPGREARIQEPLDFSAEMIAQVLADRIDIPYAIYGHSMGARLGFEVVRCLRAMGAPNPLRFYPGASLPPDMRDPFAACIKLADGPFIDALIEHLGAPRELRDVPELRAFQLPLLRHDLGWCHSYRFQPADALPTTLVAFAGQTDGIATPAAMAGWSRHARRCTVVTLPGGHFFLRTCEEQLTSVLRRDLLLALDSDAAPADRSPSVA